MPHRLVDTHVHVWDPGHLKYPWLEGVPRLNIRMLPADIDRTGGADSMVFVQAESVKEQAEAEVDWVAALEWPELAGIVAHAGIEAPDATDQLDRLAATPLVVGVRRILQGEAAGWLRRPDLVAGLRAVGNAGLVFDATVRADQLGELAELLGEASETVVVLDHLGNPPTESPWSSAPAGVWRAGIHAVAANPMAILKVSGLSAEARSAGAWGTTRAYVAEAIDAFGVHRVMLGSDFPVSARGDAGTVAWWEVLDDLGLGKDEQAAVRSGTASTVYRITTPRKDTPQ
jgi:L-fuconolactonase